MVNKTKETFESWVTDIPDVLAEFFKAISISDKLDFSIGSLDTLEAYLLINFTRETFVSEENKFFIDACARYIGETFRLNLPGAIWDIELDDPKKVFYNLPIIIGGSELKVPFCPHRALTALFARKQGNYLSTTLNNYITEGA